MIWSANPTARFAFQLTMTFDAPGVHASRRSLDGDFDLGALQCT